MRVLNVNAVLDPVTGGGTAERTVQITRSLLTQGIDCRIMTTDVGFSDGKLPGLEGIQVTAYHCILKRFYVPLVRYSYIRNIVKDADIVHIMGHWTILNALVYLAARSLNKPYVVCPAGALPIFGRSRLLKKIYNYFIGNKIIQSANAWIAITEDEKKQFVPYKVNANNITVIPNGINPDDFSYCGVNEFKKNHGITDRKLMMFMGRLNIIKGPDMLLDAYIQGYHNWHDWDLVFAGPDGGLLVTLKKTVRTHGLSERVHFIGYVGGKEKSAAYHAADLLVIPSRQEAMSTVVLEAGISSTPVVITDQCGFSMIGEVGGGKVSPATKEGICQSINEVIQSTESLSTMGEQLHKLVESKFTWNVVIQKYVDLYKFILSKT